MTQWQNLLIQGNANYAESNWLQAEYCYRKAESLLNNVWLTDQNNEEILLAWICSAHNLAALYEKRGDNRVSLQYLLLPHQRLLMLCQNEHNNEQLTMTAIRSLSITLNPIILFRQKHNLCQECYKALSDIDEFHKRQNNILSSLH